MKNILILCERNNEVLFLLKIIFMVEALAEIVPFVHEKENEKEEKRKKFVQVGEKNKT